MNPAPQWRLAMSADPSCYETAWACLLALGADETAVAEEADEGASVLTVHGSGVWLRSLKRELAGRGVAARLERVDPSWRYQWQRHVRPFRLAPGLRVVPEWHGAAAVGSDLVLEADLVFGIGTHPTTRMLASWLERHKGAYRAVLDVGTGTGVLALAAARFGAEKVTALDCDPRAVEAARRNVRRNGAKQVKVLRADFRRWRARARYDFVLANLHSAILLEGRSWLTERVAPGGLLALSGVDAASHEAIRAYGPPLRRLQLRRRSGWLAALYQREATPPQDRSPGAPSRKRMRAERR